MHLRRVGAVSALLGVLSLLASCRNEHDDDLRPAQFHEPAVPLTGAEAEGVIQRAAAALDSPDLHVAVVDRVGNVLAAWRRTDGPSVVDLDRAVSIARSAAFLSSSQGPLSSRTLEFISTFHFPATFGEVQPPPFPTLTPQRSTTGVKNTPQGHLWQIFSSNRGGPLSTDYQPGQVIPPAGSIDGSFPGPGLGYLPGGIPLYSGGRLVGGVGCYGPAPDACEFAALQGAGAFAFAPIQPEGAIFLVGILLPYVEQTARPPGSAPGVFDPAGLYPLPPLPDQPPLPNQPPLNQPPPPPSTRNGWVDREGALVGPLADPLGNLTVDDVARIVSQAVSTANGTRAAIRVPLGTTTKMVIAVTNLEGRVLAIHRMPDAPIFSIDVAVTKARTVVYYSGPDLDPADAIPGVPLGTAITTRTLGFLSQPLFPPNVTSSFPGPLFDVALENQNPVQFNRMGRALPSPFQSGLIFFPGSAPLYKNGVLVGGLGISGDGVEQDDFVTSGAARGFEPPPGIRADNFQFAGEELPYFKFPQLPGTGR